MSCIRKPIVMGECLYILIDKSTREGLNIDENCIVEYDILSVTHSEKKE